jgi:hypothetical protein
MSALRVRKQVQEVSVLINKRNIIQNKKQHTDMKQKQWRLGKEPKGGTYIEQVIREVMESR